MPCDWSSDVCSRSEEHTSELQSHDNLVCRLLLEKTSPAATAAAPPPPTAASPTPRPPRPPRGTVGAQNGRSAARRGRAGPAARRLCFFNDTATTEIYTLSLHDALPI